MVKLEVLLNEMERYDWNPVADIGEPMYRTYSIEEWSKTISEFGLILEGSVLDVACGAISLGAIYNDVVGYDIDPKLIKAVRNSGIKGIIGDMCDLPFDDNSFDIVTCFYPDIYPLNAELERPTAELGGPPSDFKGLSYIMTAEFIRVARKKVLMTNINFNKEDVPACVKRYISRQDDYFTLFDLQKSVPDIG